MKTCKQCSHQNRDDLSFCSKCGEFLDNDTHKLCPSCQTINHSRNDVCTKCNYILNKELKRCDKCNNLLDKGDRYCQHCKTKQPKTRVELKSNLNEENTIKCFKCGHENLSDVTYCASCGEYLKKDHKECPSCFKLNKLDAIECKACHKLLSSNYTKCKNCGQLNSIENKQCKNCGYLIDDEFKLCENCHKPISKDDMFCGFCGKKQPSKFLLYIKSKKFKFHLAFIVLCILSIFLYLEISYKNYDMKFTASSSDNFGYSVALDGSTLVVGAIYDDDNGSNSGSVYVYDLTKESGATGFERKITASDGAANDNFGYAVSIDGFTMVVGAYHDDDNGSNSGSVYVYDLTKESGATGFERKITASDGAQNDYFGYSVALDGSTLVVGAYYDDDNGSNSGSVYVYDLTKESGATGFERKITASDGAPYDYFGISVAIEGSILVVGARYDDDNGTNSGSVYVYDLTKATSDAGFERKIISSDGASFDNFGYSVSINEMNLFVGATGDDDNVVGSGSVYLFYIE